MFNMIKSDLYRIFHGKGIYIAFLLVIFMFVISVHGLSTVHIGNTGIYKDLKSNLVVSSEIEEKLANTQSFGESRKILEEAKIHYALDREIVGGNINLYYVLIIIVAVILTVDFSNSTIKNTLSSAVSRKKYYFSKLFTCFIVGTILILLNDYGTYFFNLIWNGSNFSSNFIDFTKLVFSQFPLFYGIISLLICISTISRKTAIYNGITIPFIMGFQLLISFLATLLHIDVMDILQYEAQIIFVNLATNPTTTYIINCCLLGLGYMIIFNLIGYYTFQKAEIK